MRLHQVSVDKNVHEYMSQKLCLTPEIKSKYFRIGECVGIGRTTVLMDKNSNFAPFQQKMARMPQSFITSQTKELFKRCLYILKYFIILYDKNGPGIDKPSKVS